MARIKIHKRRRISRQKKVTILRGFQTDITSVSASERTGVNRKTSDRYYNIFRKLIIRYALKERKEAKLGNGIEIEESYFGPKT